MKMNPKAYGLTEDQRECLVKMATSEDYYNEAYLANAFDISIVAVRDICMKMANYIPKKIEDGKCIDGRYV